MEHSSRSVASHQTRRENRITIENMITKMFLLPSSFLLPSFVCQTLHGTPSATNTTNTRQVTLLGNPLCRFLLIDDNYCRHHLGQPLRGLRARFCTHIDDAQDTELLRLLPILVHCALMVGSGVGRAVGGGGGGTGTAVAEESKDGGETMGHAVGEDGARGPGRCWCLLQMFLHLPTTKFTGTAVSLGVASAILGSSGALKTCAGLWRRWRRRRRRRRRRRVR